jgi:hypothetical protein
MLSLSMVDYYFITLKSDELRAETLFDLSSISKKFPNFAIVTHLNIVISYLQTSCTKELI